MKTTKSFKLVVLISTLILMLIAVVIVSVAWYFSNNTAKTGSASVVSDVTPTINAEIPDAFITSELYSGQTGTRYGTEDMPYILEYTPVVAEAKYLPNDNYYMQAKICGANIKLSEKDEFGDPVEEKYNLNDDIGIAMMSHFTYRLKLTKVIEKEMVEGEEVITETTPNIIYKPQNNYLVSDDANETPLNLYDSYVYYFDLQIVFQSESGYNQLMSSHADLPDSFIFPLSDPKYMFSKMSIFFSVGLEQLYQINLVKNGGTCADDYLLTTGAGNVTLPAVTRENCVFDGWYYDAEFSKQFLSDSLVNKNIKTNMSIYAKYNYNVDFQYNEPVGTTTNIIETIETNGLALSKTHTNIVTSWDQANDYQFLGWTDNLAQKDNYANYNTYKFNFTQSITGPVTLYGVWSPKAKIKVNIHTNKDSTSLKASIKRYLDYNSSTVTQNYGEDNDISIYISDGTNLATYLNTDKNKGLFRGVPSSSIYVFGSWKYKQSGLIYANMDLNTIRYVADGDINIYPDYNLG